MLIPQGSNYDVFLNFRGPDTRNGFVDCLYEHMTDAGIRVFVDNERLHTGEVIGNELIRAIDDSKICMPVFSKSYASSKWRLLELEHIMMGCSGREVWPVFYHVSPDDVKLETRLYSDDLETLEKRHGSDTVDRWRKSLKEICKFNGWNLKESQLQGKLIKEIVQQVLSKTKKRYKNVSDYIVGIEGQVEAVTKLLDDQFDGVRFVVIHGMGGIGKTALAKVIFNKVSSKFHGCSFLSDVRVNSQRNGVVKLQEQVLNGILRTSVAIYDEDEGINEIRDRCNNKKVLLILDDVDDRDQVEKLAGRFDWFGRGSRIIVTTRNRRVLPNKLLSYYSRGDNKKWKMVRGDDLGDICYHEMREMDHQHAATLFKRHAFGDNETTFDDDDLLQELVTSTGGLPLALEVVGSCLFLQSKRVWRETLKKLKSAPHKEVQHVLMISYESLEDNEKQMFVDIACFFRGTEMRFPMMYMWEASDLHPQSGMDTLLHKSLIKIVDGDIIWMHDQFIDLGREIIRMEGKSCRICIPEDAFQLVQERKGTGDVFLLNLGELSETCKFTDAEFKELVNLRVLRLSGGNFAGDFSNCFPQLRWLWWTAFPSNFQAKNFSLPNLVVLILSKTDMTEKWEGWNQLLGDKLKFLELSSCNGLTRMPDLSSCLGLEMIVLRNCNKLIELHDSIGKLHHLTHLEIRGSPNLNGLPRTLRWLKRIEKLIVIGTPCSEYRVKFHLINIIEDLKSLRHLEIENVGLESLPEEIGRLTLLEYLSFAQCVHLMSLPESIFELESLTVLNIAGTGISDLSGRIKTMKELKLLNVSGTNIRMLPKGIGCLAKLEELDLSFCRSLDEIPSEIGNLSALRVLNLHFTNIRELPSTISRLSRLEHLDIWACWKLNKIEQLPMSLCFLHLPYFSLQVVPDISKLVNLVQLTLFWNEESSEEDVNLDINWWTRFGSLNIAWIERLHQIKRLEIKVPSYIFNLRQADFRSLSQLRQAELHLSCSDAQSLSQPY